MRGIKHYYKQFKSYLRQHGFATTNSFFTMHLRPKRADGISLFIPENYSNVGIVIQGPLNHKDNFTLETVRLYKKYYPQTPIIVSTWDSEREEDLKRIQCECELCVSHFDKEEGNYQRTTSLAGIARARELGCEYIMKTRTDQRLYASQILSFLIKLIGDFPVKLNCAAKGRLVACELSTFSNRQYNISDMFIFGKSDDVLRYFSCPLDRRGDNGYDKLVFHDFLQFQADYSKLRIGEIWFASHYIESLGFELKWTFDDSDYYRNELFIIVDNAMLELYWPKYGSVNEHRWKTYTKQDSYHPVTFKEWYMAQGDCYN